MGFVQDPTRVLPVRRKVVCHDAVYLEAPSYLQYLVEDVTHRLSYLLVGYNVDVVEDAHRLPELLDLIGSVWSESSSLILCWLDIVEALVRRETSQ